MPIIILIEGFIIVIYFEKCYVEQVIKCGTKGVLTNCL